MIMYGRVGCGVGARVGVPCGVLALVVLALVLLALALVFLVVLALEFLVLWRRFSGCGGSCCGGVAVVLMRMEAEVVKVESDDMM